MIKETKERKEVIERHKFCDICGVEINIRLACSAAHCMYCRKDLCENCIGHEEDDGSDYRSCYCKRCWEIGEQYRPTIEKMETKIGQLYDEWISKCREAKTTNANQD